MEKHSSRETLALVMLIAVGAGLILAGHSAEEELASPWGSMIAGLGEASFIAGLLGLIVDRGLKAALAKDALNYMVGWEVPEKLRDAVKELVRLPSVRRHFTITYEIAECDSALPGFVRLTSCAEFAVCNLTPKRFDYQFRSRVEKSRFEAVRQAKLSNSILEMQVRERQDAAGTDVLANPSTRSLDTDNDIERVFLTTIPGKDLRWFRTRRQQYFPQDFFAILDLLPPACEGITVKVRAPTGFAVNVFFGAEEPPQPAKESDMNVWKSDAVHLPGEHVRIVWWKVGGQPKTP